MGDSTHPRRSAAGYRGGVGRRPPTRPSHQETPPMKKISLDPDALRVESFATAPATRPLAGTVHGHDATEAYCMTDVSGCCPPTDTIGWESYWCESDDCATTTGGDPSHVASCGD